MYHVRRMFGAGLPGAWPFAALARHYAPGFSGRFRRALAVSEAFIERIGRQEAFTVSRIPAGTNLFRLRVAHPDAAGYRAQLRRRGIHLGVGRDSGGAHFLVGVNETWNRASADTLAEAFIEALRT